MYKSLVEKYIKNFTFSDLENYCKKNYPFVTKEEIQVIYNYLKTRWEEIYNEDTKVLEEIKEKVSPATYKTIIKLLKMVEEKNI